MRDFTIYDYQSTVDRMTELLSEKPGWGQGYESSTGQMLIQLVADTSDHLQFMLERRSQEVYLSTARLASSVRARASGIGYRPRRRVSATGTLELVLVDEDEVAIPALGDVLINAGTRVTFDGVEFVVTEDATIPAGEDSVDLVVKQGTQRSEDFNFSAEPYLSNPTILFEDYIDMEEYSLVVGNETETYTDVEEEVSNIRLSALSFATPDQAVYDIKYVTSGMRIVFGDGIFGKQPSGTMTVSWIESQGADVDVVKTGLDFAFDTEYLTDTLNTLPSNQYRYTLRNITPIRGGKDEETIEEIRENAPEYLKSNNRAVTNSDFEFWTRRSGIGDIVDVSAYGEHETGMLIFTMNNVYLAYVTDDGLEINPEQEQDLRDYIDRYKGITTHLVFKDADRVYLGIALDFKPHPSLPISETQLYRILYDEINAYLKIQKGSIGKEFQHSEFIEHLQNLTTTFNGIKYPLTDFVKATVTGMFPVPIPHDSYDGVITLDYGYTIVTNDIWTITLDGENYSIVVASDDTVDTLVTKMRTKLFNSTSYMLAQPQANQIRIKHPNAEGTFSISTGTGDLAGYTTFSNKVQIPRPTYTSNNNVDLILPGSVKLVDVNGVTHMEDDGAGTLVAASGYNYPSVAFDYNLCLMDVPGVPAGDYYVTFQHNLYQNFIVPRDGVIALMPIQEEGDTSPDHFFSTINIVR